jgi:hypothetical protein
MMDFIMLLSYFGEEFFWIILKVKIVPKLAGE